jgi:hypothetical protein
MPVGLLQKILFKCKPCFQNEALIGKGLFCIKLIIISVRHRSFKIEIINTQTFALIYVYYFSILICWRFVVIDTIESEVLQVTAEKINKIRTIFCFFKVDDLLKKLIN